MMPYTTRRHVVASNLKNIRPQSVGLLNSGTLSWRARSNGENGATFNKGSTPKLLWSTLTRVCERMVWQNSFNQSNIPDKLIMERSGYHSTEGLREHQWTNFLQELQVCKVLDSALKGKSSYNQVATVQPPLATQFVPGFNGCTFHNCMFQFAWLPSLSQVTNATVSYHNDLTGIDQC